MQPTLLKYTLGTSSDGLHVYKYTRSYTGRRPYWRGVQLISGDRMIGADAKHKPSSPRYLDHCSWETLGQAIKTIPNLLISLSAFTPVRSSRHPCLDKFAGACTFCEGEIEDEQSRHVIYGNIVIGTLSGF